MVTLNFSQWNVPSFVAAAVMCILVHFMMMMMMSKKTLIGIFVTQKVTMC
jgi:hypothetical protein